MTDPHAVITRLSVDFELLSRRMPQVSSDLSELDAYFASWAANRTPTAPAPAAPEPTHIAFTDINTRNRRAALRYGPDLRVGRHQRSENAAAPQKLDFQGGAVCSSSLHLDSQQQQAVGTVES
jgi:hypothetical protein